MHTWKENKQYLFKYSLTIIIGRDKIIYSTAQ